MLGEVRREFGVFAEGLPVSAFIAEPTIEALARTIDEARVPPSRLTVCLQPHGSKRPVFLIHAGGGYVFFYRALAARLGPQRPVYGVRAVTKSDRPGPPFARSKSVEALAARYIKEIKTVQPRGPYTLGGACFGGVIAFEMARQLRAQGEEIAGPLLLFDSFVRDPEGGDSFDLGGAGYAVNRAILHLQRSSRLGRIQAVRYVLCKAFGNLRTVAALLPAMFQRVSRKLQLSDAVITSNRLIGTWLGNPALLEEAEMKTMTRFLDATFGLLMRYRPVAFEGKIALFKAASGLSPEPGWVGLAREGIVVHEMQGVHLDMMEEPAVIETAALVARYLSEQA
jgi:thioesterase domain-containing protein